MTRGLNSAPNGIDRIDFALARFFLSQNQTNNKAFIYTLLGPRLASATDALNTLNAIESYWDAEIFQESDPLFKELKKIINSSDSNSNKRLRLSHHRNLERVKLNLSSLINWATRSGDQLETASDESVYINASQFLLDREWFIKHLVSAKNIKPVFYVHDLIPLQYPEFFIKKEAISFEKKIKNMISCAQAIICGSATVLKSFESHIKTINQKEIKSFIYKPQIPRIFYSLENQNYLAEDHPYFVMCGTIEPRKNYPRLLQVWKELALIPSPPKLIIVGKRGWLNEEIISQIERSKILQPYVIEIEGLSTPNLARLLKGARALIAPSFAEGFGLPVAEAIAAQTPVIASDIEIFREIGRNALDYINPIDAAGWLEAIQDYASPSSLRRSETLSRIQNISYLFSQSNLNELSAFIDGL